MFSKSLTLVVPLIVVLLGCGGGSPTVAPFSVQSLDAIAQRDRHVVGKRVRLHRPRANDLRLTQSSMTVSGTFTATTAEARKNGVNPNTRHPLTVVVNGPVTFEVDKKQQHLYVRDDTDHRYRFKLRLVKQILKEKD